MPSLEGKGIRQGCMEKRVFYLNTEVKLVGGK